MPSFPEGPPRWPLPDPEVELALDRAYQDGSWGRYHGSYLAEFSRQLAEFHGVQHAFPVCSGTIAVELALRACQLQSGDEVILAGYDFPGNFRAIEAVGARPVLVDIEPNTWCLHAELLGEAISERTRGIVVSHLHGGLADMRSVRSTADHHGLFVVEDACQCPGAIVQGRSAGTWGDVGVLSFGGSKLLTAGRGGALITNNDQLYQRVRIYADRGNDAFPLTELQAAVLTPQLAKLSERNKLRAGNVRSLLGKLASQPGLIAVALPAAPDLACYYKVAWLWSDRDREAFLETAHAEGIAIDAGFRGFTKRGARRCRKVGELLHSQAAAERTLLLHHPVLLTDDTTIGQLADALAQIADRCIAGDTG